MKQAKALTVDDDYTTACFYIEKELNQRITPDYPAARFVVQLEELQKDAERQKKEADKSKRGRTFR